MRKNYLITIFLMITVLIFLTVSVKYSPLNNTESPQCYWMENYSGKAEWVPANPVYQDVLSKSECYDLDSCYGGKGKSNGRCYKWSISAHGERLPWVESPQPPQCYWIENYSGKAEWVPANPVYQNVLSESECYDLDSCYGGKGMSNGGCYKWSISAHGERLPWPIKPITLPIP